MDKKELTLEVISRLAKEYPDADCTLEYENGWQLLISVRLAAQCTDKRVDEITPKLYEKFPTVADLARADVSEIEAIVRPCGLGNVKARDISKCMKVLHEKYNDEIPRTFKELLALPGVGRKSANLVIVDGIKEPAKVERELWKLVPPNEGSSFCHRLVFHGRAVCIARRPKCNQCCLKDICAHARSLE